jgi:hypothetical protein
MWGNPFMGHKILVVPIIDREDMEELVILQMALTLPTMEEPMENMVSNEQTLKIESNVLDVMTSDRRK